MKTSINEIRDKQNPKILVHGMVAKMVELMTTCRKSRRVKSQSR